jgi:hypothetical protein
MKIHFPHSVLVLLIPACLALLIGVASPASAEKPKTPGAAQLNPQGFSASAECGKCHADIYAAWKNSLHAQASDNSVFQTAFLQSYFERGEPARQLCLTCHAPIAGINNDLKLAQPLTRENINCDFCHSIAEVLPGFNGPHYKFAFGLLKQGPRPQADVRIHTTRTNEAFSQSRYCAGCHEMDLPNGVKLIGTFSEWQASPYARENTHCQNCHMPKIPGKIVNDPSVPEQKISGHDIAGGHSISKREEAIDIAITDVSRYKNKLTVSVNVTNKGAGHKLPTGLPSKKIVLQVTVQSRSGGPNMRQEKTYQKMLVDAGGAAVTLDADLMLGKGVTIASDNRIAPQETRREQFTFFVPEGETYKISAAAFYNHSPRIVQAAEIHLKLKEVHTQTGP